LSGKNKTRRDIRFVHVVCTITAFCVSKQTVQMIYEYVYIYIYIGMTRSNRPETMHIYIRLESLACGEKKVTEIAGPGHPGNPSCN